MFWCYIIRSSELLSIAFDFFCVDLTGAFGVLTLYLSSSDSWLFFSYVSSFSSLWTSKVALLRIFKSSSSVRPLLWATVSNCFSSSICSCLLYTSIVKKIKSYNVKVKEVEIVTSPENVNNVVGYKRENIVKLKDYYDVDVKIKQDKNMKNGYLNIKVTKIYTDFLDDNDNV